MLTEPYKTLNHFKIENGIQAKIIADSISPSGVRLTTLELQYHRFVHSEMMTHRMFCLDGDSLLEFDFLNHLEPSNR